MTEERKKKRFIALEIDCDALDKKPEYPVQQGLEVWEKEGDISKEWTEAIVMLRYIARFLGRSINEMPECKDNYAKRSISAKMIFEEFMKNLNLNGYTIRGILNEMLDDLYFDMVAQYKIIDLFIAQRKKDSTEQRYVT